jgi:membrane protease YdiL (CAAX protease family)
MVAGERNRLEIGRAGFALLVFFACSLGFTWIVLMLLRQQTVRADSTLAGVLQFAVAWEPTIFAIMVVAAFARDSGLKRLFGRLRIQRNRLRWLIFAFIFPFTLVVSVILIAHASGNRAPFADGRHLIGAIVFTLLTGAIGEELGWRGFALPALQRRMRALPATFLLACAWAFFHITAFDLEDPGHTFPHLPLIGAIFCFTFLISLVVNEARGSVLPAMAAHSAINMAGGVNGANPTAGLVWGGFALYAFMALNIVLVTNPDTLTLSQIRPLYNA